MKLRTLTVAASLGLAFIVIPSSTSARSLWSHDSNLKSCNIDIATPMQLPNRKMLPAGNYKVQFPLNETSPEVVFYLNGKVVARDAAKVVSEPKKNDRTEVSSTKHGDAEVINSISPIGVDKQLVFNQ